MASFIIKRLLLVIPLMILVSFIIFLVMGLSSVDPAQAYLLNAKIPPTPEAIESVRQQLGLDKPILVQYINWFKGVLVLDFGTSFSTNRPVLQDVLYYFPTTLKLAGASMLFVALLSIPAGVLAAVRRNTLVDKIVKTISFFGVSIPSFWLGFLLIYIFSVQLNWLPPFGDEGFKSYIMPVITLSFMSIAINARLTRTSVLEHLTQRSVLYQKAIGMTKQKLYGKYTLKNSMLPIVTAMGMHFGELIGGAVIVETLFAWPGVGRYAVGAIIHHDHPVILCFMMIMTAIFVITNLIIDIVYAYLNPRIRYD